MEYNRLVEAHAEIDRKRQKLKETFRYAAMDFYSTLRTSVIVRRGDSSILDEEGDVLDFNEYSLHTGSFTEPGHLTYTANDGENFFLVPYEFVSNPEGYKAKQNQRVKEAQEMVSNAYNKLAPLAKETYPTMHPLIKTINDKENKAHAVIVDGEATGITLGDPRGEILIANILTVDLTTGEITSARML